MQRVVVRLQDVEIFLPCRQQDTGLSFMSPQSKRRSGLGLQSDSASNSTPSKLLLMRGERQMNILSPEEGTSLHQVATRH